MLKKIRIHNLAVVEDVELELSPGLNVLTGSTGAGKSLILGAVNLLQSQKASTGSIRAGKDRALVECLFELEPGAGGGIDPCLRGAARLTLRREIRRNGRSYAFVNGAPAAVKQLRQISLQLFEPHGQNEQFRLKNPDNHVDYVDACAGNETLLERYRENLQDYKKAQRELGDFDSRLALLNEKQELLQHRIEEIERAAFTAGELDELEARILLLENSEKIFETLNLAYSALEDDDAGAVSGVSQAAKALSRIDDLDRKLGEISAQLQNARITLQDCAESVRSYIDRAEFDPLELASMQERRAFLLELQRRYGLPLGKIIEARGRWAKELESVAFEDEERARLEKKLKKSETALEKAALELSESRKSAAQRLDTQMNRELKDLKMHGARFRTDIRYDTTPGSTITAGDSTVCPGPGGIDTVRFRIKANRGEAEGAVDEIASTGETSRIALALKKITNLGRPGSVLIFDELDAGVGADLGDAISEKLLDLSTHYQIICITHLPQIAAKGQRHLVVSKRSDKNRTYAEVSKVDGDNRLREVARMLGGVEGSDKRKALAAELLEGARNRRSTEKRP